MHTIARNYLRLFLLTAASAASLVLAFLLRFEFAIPQIERPILESALCLFIPIKGVVFSFFRLHKSAWRMIGLFDLLRVFLVNMAASVLTCIAALAVIGSSMPRSVYVLDAILCFVAIAGLQFSVRLYKEVVLPNATSRDARKSVLIYGAGVAGHTLVKEIRSNNKLAMRVIGFIDDDRRKVNRVLDGVPVLATGRELAHMVAKFKRGKKTPSEIIIAMPSATSREMRAAIANCRSAGIPFRTVPSLGEMLNGKVLSQQIREVSVNDLLGRAPVNLDESKIGQAINGKVIMITGGCGSIGSELCRQVARFGPGTLVIFDQAESELFMLALELRGRFPNVKVVTELGDICHTGRVQEAIHQHAVEIIFHAAAYKHVPMMEANPLEAVENNVLGTYNLAQAAQRYGVRKFVMISTDKAVNPTSVMGATKRAAELIVSAMPLDRKPSATSFVCVRFGNVLASAGSVVRIFQQQIASGGPVTVTHPDMKRYFMSIQEAVQLVVQASTMGSGSEVFILEMGEPVPIVELAHNMIRLAGFVPNEDIEVRFTGMRPGEKLFEELRIEDEDILPTYHQKIKILKSYGPGAEQVLSWLDTLRVLVKQRNSTDLKSHLKALVPEYDAYQGGATQAKLAEEYKVKHASS